MQENRRDTCSTRGGKDTGGNLLREDASKAKLPAPVSVRKRGAYIRFCETNPIFCEVFFGVTANVQMSCDGKVMENNLGSFWKTNPIWGVF